MGKQHCRVNGEERARGRGEGRRARDTPQRHRTVKRKHGIKVRTKHTQQAAPRAAGTCQEERATWTDLSASVLPLGSATRRSSEGGGQPQSLPSAPQVDTGETSVGINPAGRKRGRLRYALGGWSLKRGKYFQNPREVALRT